ncbi:MAG: hypothetical protein HYV07_01110 [Deltaproteobacteria bacterium]|nr:hypothetical protein [Deltaproteobacteria bacterium]
MRWIEKAIPIAVCGLFSACTNPTVDPASTFKVEGKALKADGTPLIGAEVKLVRYFDPAKLYEPSVEDLFTCVGDCSYLDIDFEIEVVMSATADANGSFSMEFLGADVAADNGITDAQGLVESSKLIVVVKDPNDPEKRTGVYTREILVQQSIKTYNVGDLELWDANALVSFATPGLVTLKWNKIERPATSRVDNYYRVQVGGDNSAQFVARCYEGVDATEGGCSPDGAQLSVTLSAMSVYTYYSDAGVFSAYIRGAGVDFRYQARFEAEALPDPTATRDPAGLAGIWAVNDTENQSLFPSLATDGNPRTREPITIASSAAIYVKLNGAVSVTDAGLLGSLVRNASSGCVLIEFNTSEFPDVDTAKTQATGWTRKGKFCGGNGSDQYVHAMVGFEFGQTAAWMRYQLVVDLTGSAPTYLEVGEVAVYKARN